MGSWERMGRQRNTNGGVIGLDVGTTKICVVTGQTSNDGVSVTSARTFPSTGLRKGVVIDADAAADAIRRAISETVQSGDRSLSVCVGIAGSHIKSISSEGGTNLKGKKVTSQDIAMALDAASAAYVPQDREILHVLPTDFILDGQGGIKDPVGLAGMRLDVKVTVVTGAVAAVQNLLKACSNAGITISDIVLQPIASAEATLTARERSQGVALVDIGGGTTDIAVYRDGWLVKTAVLGIGGNHFTNDLSVGLEVSFPEAERIKKMFGSVSCDERQEKRPIKVALANGHVKTISAKDISSIIQPRAEETLELVMKEIDEVRFSGADISQTVLTGGSSLLSGLEPYAAAVLRMPVRIGYPEVSVPDPSVVARSSERRRVRSQAPELSHPMYATGIGLVLYTAESQEQTAELGDPSQMFQRIAATMSGWFKNFLGKR
ncbi:MAG TPA: cell division protein FtsA [Dissulfurispiraceae bacterium]|nr:cell division protein FtsA [Dissulfurispiraceae bacterium]